MPNVPPVSQLTPLVVCAFSILASIQVRGEDAGELLSLGRAVSEALLRNDRILDARDAVEQTDLAVRLARNAFRPKITPNILGSLGDPDLANQTYRLDLAQKLPWGTEFHASAGTVSSQNQLGTYYNSDTTLEISQPFLRGFGKATATRQLKSAEVRQADALRQRTLQEQRLAVEVAGAYFRIVSQARLSQVSEKSLERARRLLEASEAKLQAGKVSQLDVARAQQLVAQAEGQVLDAGGAVEDARDYLRLLMGREGGGDFAVDPEIPTLVEPVDEEAAVQLALARRLELDSAREAQADAEQATSFAKNQLLPQFDLRFALTRRETAPSFRTSFGWDNFRLATFFAISTPVDRTPQTIEFHNTLIERDRRKREVRNLGMRIAAEARHASRQQARLIKGLEVADAALSFARTELEVAELRYQRGLSNNLDVVTAESNLLATEGRRLTTLADLAVARLNLKASLGTLDPRVEFALEAPVP